MVPVSLVVLSMRMLVVIFVMTRGDLTVAFYIPRAESSLVDESVETLQGTPHDMDASRLDLAVDSDGRCILPHSTH